MSDYSRQHDFSTKTGTTIFGSEVDDEFDALVIAVNSKVDESREASALGIATLDASALLPAGISGNAVSGGGQIPEASETALGAVELATTTEVNALTDPLRVVTPAGLASALTQAAGNGISEASGVLSISTDLTDIAALAKTDGNVIVANGTNWVAESGATARTSLGLAIGTDVQAWDAQLDDIAALAVTNGNFIVGNGSAWVAESGATARNSLSLGTGDSPQFTAVNIGSASDTTVSREAAGHIAVEGQTVAQHGTGQTNANYSSADIFMSTSAASGGASGDIWFQYTA
jgi:hypothetical protein